MEPFDPSTYTAPAGWQLKQSTGLIDGRQAYDVLNELRVAQGQDPVLERIPPKATPVDPSSYAAPSQAAPTPPLDAIQRYNAVRDYQDEMAAEYGDQLTPELYAQLGQQARQEFDMIHPEQYMPQVLDLPGTDSLMVSIGGKQHILPKSQAPKPDIALEKFKVEMADRETAIKAAEQKQAEAAQSKAKEIASAYNDIGQSIELVDEVAKHPGLPGAVGMQLGASVIPGTDAADFVTRLDRLRANNFIEGVRKMKAAGGAGALSDAEGKKLDIAMAALNRAQSEASFKQELASIREIFAVSQARSLAELKSLGIEPQDAAQSSSPATTQKVWNPATNQLEDAPQ